MLPLTLTLWLPKEKEKLVQKYAPAFGKVAPKLTKYLPTCGKLVPQAVEYSLKFGNVTPKLADRIPCQMCGEAISKLAEQLHEKVCSTHIPVVDTRYI